VPRLVNGWFDPLERGVELYWRQLPLAWLAFHPDHAEDLAAPPSAQPLFHAERDWTVEVGGKRYGVRDVAPKPGDFRWAEVWFRDRRFVPAHDPADRWVLALPLVDAVFAVRHLTRWVGRGPRRQGT
jgi:hypothetical protein